MNMRLRVRFLEPSIIQYLLCSMVGTFSTQLMVLCLAF